jgi:hypothetical protein
VNAAAVLAETVVPVQRQMRLAPRFDLHTVADLLGERRRTPSLHMTDEACGSA